jgi:hypothetical protein
MTSKVAVCILAMWRHMTDCHNIHTLFQGLFYSSTVSSAAAGTLRRTVSRNLDQHGNLVEMSVLVWFTHSINHPRVLCIGIYTQQAAVSLFKSTPHEQCSEDSLHNVWHKLHLHTVGHPTRLDCILHFLLILLPQIWNMSLLCVIVWVTSFHLTKWRMTQERSNSHNDAGDP